MQHAAPDLLTEWRRAVVVEALGHAGLDAPVAEPIRTWGSGRRRARWAARRTREGVLLGYNQRRDRRIVDIAECPQLAEPVFAVAAPVRGALAEALAPGARADVAVTAADNGIDVLLVGPRTLSTKARIALANLCQEQDWSRISWQPADRELPETVVMVRTPVVSFAGHAVAIPPNAFLQATAQGEAALVDFACAALAGAGHVADLYAGCGSFTLPLSRSARVTAFEMAPAMVDALAAALRSAQLSGRVTVARRDLERRPLQADELKRLDGVLLDPPRAGASAQCTTLAGSAVPRIVMASCHPASFARDARILVDGGYRLVAVQPIDQFGWSHHVELIARFER